MPEVMNDLRVRCPKCASEDITPIEIKVNRADPPLELVVTKDQVIFNQVEIADADRVSVKIDCNACGAGVFWVNTVLESGEVWVKLSGDPDDDEQGPQAEAVG